MPTRYFASILLSLMNSSLPLDYIEETLFWWALARRTFILWQSLNAIINFEGLTLSANMVTGYGVHRSSGDFHDTRWWNPVYAPWFQIVHIVQAHIIQGLPVQLQCTTSSTQKQTYLESYHLTVKIHWCICTLPDGNKHGQQTNSVYDFIKSAPSHSDHQSRHWGLSQDGLSWPQCPLHTVPLLLFAQYLIIV